VCSTHFARAARRWIALWITKPAGFTSKGEWSNLLALEVDLHQAGGRDLVEEDAVGVDEERVLGARHAQRDMREDEVFPLVEGDQPIRGGEVDAGGPFLSEGTLPSARGRPARSKS